MPKTWFITYADERYLDKQLELCNNASGSENFDEILPYSKNWLSKTEFYQKNKSILDDKYIGLDGRPKPGFFLWKPFIILETIYKMAEGDILLYMDCGDVFTEELSQLKSTLLNVMQGKDLLLTAGAFPNYMYTKRDAFILTGCDMAEVHNAIQIEAGIFVCKKTTKTAIVVKEWLDLCCDRRVISSDENKCGLPNLEGFIESRWDQGCLSLLKEKLNLYTTDLMRKFISCNKND